MRWTISAPTCCASTVKRLSSTATARRAFHPGSYTVSAHVPLGSVVGATRMPPGRRAVSRWRSVADGRPDFRDQRRSWKSVSKLDNYLLSNGTLLNVKFTPATLSGESGSTSWPISYRLSPA